MAIKGNYGKSEDGNFEVIDTIPTTHPYMIGSKHVEYAADKFSGRLGEEAIAYAERVHNYCCRICHKPYSQHKSALVVACRKPFKDAEGKATPELHAYLLKCKDECEKNGYAGFAFLDHTNVTN